MRPLSLFALLAISLTSGATVAPATLPVVQPNSNTARVALSPLGRRSALSRHEQGRRGEQDVDGSCVGDCERAAAADSRQGVSKASTSAMN